MRCIEWRIRRGAVGVVGVVGAVALGLLEGCSPREPLPVSAPSAPPSSRSSAGGVASQPPPPVVPRAGSAPVALPLPAPAPMRTWNEVRRQAALRMVAANPAGTYTGEVVEPLLAIPVLEIELNRDGSIRRIVVLREPGQARDTTSLAVAAVRSAAPFGDVSRLPRPWRFTETFLFNEDRKFKPRTLD